MRGIHRVKCRGSSDAVPPSAVRNHNSDINALVDFSVSLLFFFAEPCASGIRDHPGPSYHRDGVTLNGRPMQGRIFVEIRILRKSPKKKRDRRRLVAAPPLAPTGEPTLGLRPFQFIKYRTVKGSRRCRVRARPSNDHEREREPTSAEVIMHVLRTARMVDHFDHHRALQDYVIHILVPPFDSTVPPHLGRV
ncbi:hypothetical protein BGY98DRAFT_947938 [Russula aff. rugulosa BPL654]|nr:hypothetical protein BGY98DRAFT_947938 [Russula aff. rugulosa BPL654]